LIITYEIIKQPRKEQDGTFENDSDDGKLTAKGQSKGGIEYIFSIFSFDF
jgi:hypothetical protein